MLEKYRSVCLKWPGILQPWITWRKQNEKPTRSTCGLLNLKNALSISLVYVCDRILGLWLSCYSSHAVIGGHWVLDPYSLHVMVSKSNTTNPKLLPLLHDSMVADIWRAGSFPQGRHEYLWVKADLWCKNLNLKHMRRSFTIYVLKIMLVFVDSEFNSRLGTPPNKLWSN